MLLTLLAAGFDEAHSFFTRLFERMPPPQPKFEEPNSFVISEDEEDDSDGHQIEYDDPVITDDPSRDREDVLLESYQKLLGMYHEMSTHLMSTQEKLVVSNTEILRILALDKIPVADTQPKEPYGTRFQYTDDELTPEQIRYRDMMRVQNDMLMHMEAQIMEEPEIPQYPVGTGIFTSDRDPVIPASQGGV